MITKTSDIKHHEIRAPEEKVSFGRTNDEKNASKKNEETKSSDSFAIAPSSCESLSTKEKIKFDWQTEWPPSQALINAMKNRGGGFYDPAWISPFTITEEEYYHELSLLKKIANHNINRRRRGGRPGRACAKFEGGVAMSPAARPSAAILEAPGGLHRALRVGVTKPGHGLDGLGAPKGSGDHPAAAVQAAMVRFRKAVPAAKTTKGQRSYETTSTRGAGHTVQELAAGSAVPATPLTYHRNAPKKVCLQRELIPTMAIAATVVLFQEQGKRPLERGSRTSRSASTSGLAPRSDSLLTWRRRGRRPAEAGAAGLPRSMRQRHGSLPHLFKEVVP